jgi:hypothetical protein
MFVWFMYRYRLCFNYFIIWLWTCSYCGSFFFNFSKSGHLPKIKNINNTNKKIKAPNSVKWMSKTFLRHTLIKKISLTFLFLTTYLYTFSLYENPSFIIFSAETEYISYQVRVITVFTVFRLLTDFVCLYTYEFWLSLCKIVRNSVILLLLLLSSFSWTKKYFWHFCWHLIFIHFHYMKIHRL